MPRVLVLQIGRQPNLMVVIMSRINGRVAIAAHQAL